MKRQKNQIGDLDIELKKLSVEKGRLEIENQKATLSKTQKEEEKLDLEIKHLKTPWFRKPQWAAFYVPLILCIGSLWISNKQNANQVEKAISQYKTTILEHEKDSLSGVIVSYQKVTSNKNENDGNTSQTSFTTKLTYASYPASQLTSNNGTINLKPQVSDCDQLCGQGHYSMRGVITVESQQEFDKWLKSVQNIPYSLITNPIFKELRVSDEEISAFVLRHTKSFTDREIAPM